MGLFERFPYTNFHELNAEWMLRKVKELDEAMKTFIAEEAVKFADPIIWNISSQYAKSTIVMDTSGNAFLSKKVVPAGIQLNNTEYWLEVFNFADYVRTANQNLTAHVEADTTRATAAYNVDDWLLWDDVLYKVTTAIAADDLLIVKPDPGYNLEHFTVEDFIKAWIVYANGLIQQYKNDIDASELAYRQQLAQDIADTTALLQAQLNAAIAGATVDSEVILARVGANGITYPTLGDAIRSQVSSLTNVSIVATKTEDIFFTDGAYIDLTVTPVDITTPLSSIYWRYAVADCNEGDIFTLSVDTAGQKNPYAFIDNSGNILSIGYTSESLSGSIITAPAGSTKLVIDDRMSGGHCFKGYNLNQQIIGNINALLNNDQIVALSPERTVNNYAIRDDNTVVSYTNGRIAFYPIKSGSTIYVDLDSSFDGYRTCQFTTVDSASAIVGDPVYEGFTGFLIAPATANYITVCYAANKKAPAIYGIPEEGQQNDLQKLTTMLLLDSNEYDLIPFETIDNYAIKTDGTVVYEAGSHIVKYKVQNNSLLYLKILKTEANRKIWFFTSSANVSDIVGSYSSESFTGFVKVPEDAEYLILTYVGSQSPFVGNFQWYSHKLPYQNVIDPPYWSLHLDVADKYFSIANLETIIDDMAAAGFNQLQLNISNVGFRLELDDMTVTDVNGNIYDLTPILGHPDEAPTSWYTQAQMDSIIAYANARGIDIVPCIDMPGHMERILLVFTQFNKWSTLDLTDEDAVNFGLAIADKFSKYFASRGCHYYCIGFDEIMAGHNGFDYFYNAGTYKYVNDFALKIVNLIKQNGLIPRLWNDGAFYRRDYECYMPKDAEILYWTYYDPTTQASATELFKMGYKMINSNAGYYWVLGDPNQQVTVGQIEATNLFRNFHRDPQDQNGFGAQFCIWCKYVAEYAGDNGDYVLSQIEPLIAAFGDRIAVAMSKIY